MRRPPPVARGRTKTTTSDENAWVSLRGTSVTSLFYRVAVGSRLRASNGVLISVREKGARGEGWAFRAAAHYRLVDVCAPALLYINIVPRLVVAVAVVGRPQVRTWQLECVCAALQRLHVLAQPPCQRCSAFSC